MTDWQNRTVLVTGGARRAGARIVRCFAEAGAAVIVHCNTSHCEAESLLAELPGSGHRILSADFSVPGEAQTMFARAGRVDLLVNNASLFTRSAVSGECSEAEERVLLEVNYHSPLALMRAMVAQPGAPGAIVNVLDQALLRSGAVRSAYWRSRRMLLDATLDFARRFAPAGWRINAVAPGPMYPPVWLPQSRMEHELATVPLGRPVDPDDLAAAIRSLAGNPSITGAVLPVDCGQHLA